MSPPPVRSVSFICVAGQMLLNSEQRFTYISAARGRLLAYLHPLVFWLGESDKRCSEEAMLRYSSSCRNRRYLKQASKECCHYSYQILVV